MTWTRGAPGNMIKISKKYDLDPWSPRKYEKNMIWTRGAPGNMIKI